MANIRWTRIGQMCCRCKKEATHKFEKKTLFRKRIRFYCDDHMLERVMEEKLK